MTDWVSVTLLRGKEGVHLILANPLWHQLRERAKKIPGDKKHVEGFLHRIIALRSSIQHRNIPGVLPPTMCSTRFPCTLSASAMSER
jgi:hypothetical protein